MSKRRVVLTGAAGYIAQRMFTELSERWELVPIDARPTPRDGKAVPGIVVADLTRPDRNEYRRHFRGPDAGIHCAYVSAPGLDATTWQDNSDAKFWAEHQNVALAYNVLPDRDRGGRPPGGGGQLQPRRGLLRAADLGRQARDGHAGHAAPLRQLV